MQGFIHTKHNIICPELNYSYYMCNCGYVSNVLSFNACLFCFSLCAGCRSLVSWVCCGVSASSPVSTQSTPTSPCRSTRSSSMASCCSSSSTPSRPATTNHVSGSSSCWSVHSIIYKFERVTVTPLELLCHRSYSL